MTNHISILPTEMLAYPFSFLEPKELARIARVSKEWYNVQEIEELWKRHCLDHLDSTELCQATWKDQFKVIQNWMHAKAEKKSFDPYVTPYDETEKSNLLTVLEDDTALTVYFDSSLAKYVIHNFSNNEIIPIDHAELKDNKIVTTTIHNKTLAVLTERGKILFFDLPKGQYLKEITPPEQPDQISKALIKCTDQEVITAYNNEIKIWDANTGLLNQTIDTSKLGTIRTLNSTSNFIICGINDGARKTVSIRKSDHQISPIECLFLKSNCIANSESYVAMIYSVEKGDETIHKINIFLDTGKNLELISTFEALNSQISNDIGSVYIYKNWLLASRDGKSNVYDMKTGKQLSTIQHNESWIEFCSNATQLFTRTVVNENGQQKYQCTLYNFKRPVTNLHPPINHSKVPLKMKMKNILSKKCSIQ
ncbi:MAG TPA: F-box/WD40 repeat-containing protein [Rhabdochlamydiaceae bacterium]|nr:F-box/WD40 repeat-containing protein [Rhabdochlamydiaceae bacterium]